MRQPALAVAADPFLAGRLPTMTQPGRSATSPVVSPTPPGHRPATWEALMCANRVRWPPGEISTIVVPVPCRLALLLKLLTSTSPRCSRPRLCRTTATPYGFTSPLCGTVEAMFVSLWKCAMNGELGVGVAPAAGPIASPAALTVAAVAATVTNRLSNDIESPLLYWNGFSRSRGSLWARRGRDVWQGPPAPL